jgi:hypothetical protein
MTNRTLAKRMRQCMEIMRRENRKTLQRNWFMPQGSE